MPTRNINLTEQLDRFVAAEVDSGRYGNASEVVREGLRMMRQRKLEENVKLKWLRAAVREGIMQLDSGQGIAFDSIDALNKHVDGLGREASAKVKASRKRA